MLRKAVDKLSGRRDISTIVFGMIFVPLFLILIGLMIYSLRWHLTADSTLMMYFAFLFDKFGYLPYKDVIDPNLPGTYLLYYLVGHFSGYSDLGFRIADIIYVCLILLVTYLLLKRIDKKAAWAAVITFGLIYMDEGPTLSFQRELLIILPLVLSIYLTETHARLKFSWRYFLVGVSLGVAFIIKPHAAIFMPALILLRSVFRYEGETFRLGKACIFSLLGFLMPLSVAAFYIEVNGLWPYFINIASNYWPLYSEISGDFTVIQGKEKYLYILRKFFEFGEINREFLPGIIGIVVALKYSPLTEEQKKLVKVMLGMALIGLIYPIFSAKMWFYHYLIFYYFLILLGSLCLLVPEMNNNLKRQGIAVVLIGIFLLGLFPPIWELRSLGDVLAGRKDPYLWHATGRMASVLKRELKPGDYVQPLDWCNGVLGAMLLAQAPMATKIPYNVDLYHHISNPFVQKLRVDFMHDLELRKTRFIIKALNQVTWVTGPDTATDFPELDNYIKRKYTVNTLDDKFIIYERKPGI